MSKAARVESIDAIRLFRASLLTFAEKANVALGEAESEVQRVMSWLENEQTQHWTSELRKRQEAVAKAKESLRFKQVFKSQTGAKQSTVDEEKALAIAERRLAEAQQKMVNTKRWMRQLQKEAHVYRGTVQRLSTTVQVDLPTAAGKMDRMIQSLESYVALNAPTTDFGSEGAAGGAFGAEVGCGSVERDVAFQRLDHPIHLPGGGGKVHLHRGGKALHGAAIDVCFLLKLAHPPLGVDHFLLRLGQTPFRDGERFFLIHGRLLGTGLALENLLESEGFLGLGDRLLAFAQFAGPVLGLLVFQPAHDALHLGLRLAQRDVGLLGEGQQRSAEQPDGINGFNAGGLAHGMKAPLLKMSASPHRCLRYSSINVAFLARNDTCSCEASRNLANSLAVNAKASVNLRCSWSRQVAS